MKREYIRNGPFRSSPVKLPFNTRLPPVFFLNGRPLYRSNGELFFDAYLMWMGGWMGVGVGVLVCECVSV